MWQELQRDLTVLNRIHPGTIFSNIGDLAKTWSPADREAFESLLGEERAQSFLQAQLDDIQSTKEELRSKPNTAAGLLAAWWLVGCHPSQQSTKSEQDSK